MKPNQHRMMSGIAVNRNKGFALVVTLLLLLLLSLLCVGMLSLSSVTLRSSSRSDAMADAMANARMALVIAIGELQRYTGADTRVTASSELIDPNAPPVVGVWKSWEGINHDTATGRPLAPDYGLKSVDNGSANARFLKWLVSNSTIASDGKITSPTKSPAGNTVPLLAGGSLKPSDTRQMHVVPTALGKNGRFAWWVSPENQKARLAQPHKPRKENAAGWVEMGQSHLVPNPGAFGLDALLDDPENYETDPNNSKPASRAISLDTTELISSDNAAQPQFGFHDLSTSAVGLLTNTATGGWRKDLSLLTEKWDSIYSGYPGGKLPLFRYSNNVGATTLVPKPVEPAASALATNAPVVAAATPAQSNLYPWSNYSLILGVNNTPAPNTYQAAAASWQSLVGFATAYKSFSYGGGFVESPFVWDTISNQNSTLKARNIYRYKHTQRMYPQIARFQFLVYAKAVITSAPGANPTRYRVDLLYVPVFTLWNPYNVGLTYNISADPTVEAIGFGWRRALPGVMAVVNKATYPDPSLVPKNLFKMFNSGNFQYLDVGGNHGEMGYENALAENVAKGYATGMSNGVMKVQILGGLDMRTFMASLPSGPLTFKPGEAKVFSPDGRLTAGFGGTGLGLKEGYSPSTVEGRPVNNIMSNLTSTQQLWFLYKTDKLTQPYKNRKPGLGFTLSYGRASGTPYLGQPLHTSISEELHSITSVAPEKEGNIYWPANEVDEVGYSVGELASGPWIPIFSMSLGPRTTIGTGAGTKQNRPTKGLLQSDPLASMSLVDPVSGDAKAHPANGTFDMTYHSLSLGSTLTPNLSNSAGYIATGYQSGDGLSRMIMDVIPLRPMASLVELQGWNPRGSNPYPPFQANLIGNSDATPLVPNDDIVPPVLAPSGIDKNLMHDDAYCANHLLFDDWFVSSVAPQPQVLGGNMAKDIETVYGDFLSGETKLSNRSYQAIPEDKNLSSSQVTAQVQKMINSTDGWLKMASRLEVDGMFNVNSTSVDAWKAVLGHARSRELIALHGKNGIEGINPAGDHPVTRGAVGSDVEAGSGPAIGGQAGNASEYTGFRSLTDAQIDDLAVKIVEQVRLRGPFLSLAEFVNRRLSTNDDMALAGAVQTAINRMSDDPMKKLGDPANSLSATTMPESDPKLTGAGFGVGYKFAKAAEGSSAYGAPGWFRQADILRPIAPILSARDDTFTIRAYGDKLDRNGKVVATAWCEAVVKRTRDFCNESDSADSIDPPKSPMNTEFGRKYQVVTFRWLSAEEV